MSDSIARHEADIANATIGPSHEGYLFCDHAAELMHQLLSRRGIAHDLVTGKSDAGDSHSFVMVNGHRYDPTAQGFGDGTGETVTHFPGTTPSASTPKGPAGVPAPDPRFTSAVSAAARGDMEKVSPAAFGAAFNNNKAKASLSEYSPEELSKMDLYKLKGTQIYYALKGIDNHDITGQPEKDIVGVMNNDAHLPGVATPAVMLHAIEHGATTLDAFDVNGFLPTRYGRFGFKEIGRDKFDPQYYSEPGQLDAVKSAWKTQGWKEGDPYPDVVYMKYGGTGTEPNRATARANYLAGRPIDGGGVSRANAVASERVLTGNTGVAAPPRDIAPGGLRKGATQEGDPLSGSGTDGPRLDSFQKAYAAQSKGVNAAVGAPKPIVKSPDHEITSTGGEGITFRNRDVVQPGDDHKISIEDAWNHIQKHGGGVGGTMYDRTMVGKYVPRYANSGIDYDLHGGSRYVYDRIAEGTLAGAALAKGMGTIVNRMANHTGGSLMIAVGDHKMSVGNTDFSKVYDLETNDQISRRRVNSAGVRLTRAALDEAVADAAPLTLGDPSVKTWPDYMAKHESYTFEKRNKFLSAVGGNKVSRVRGTVPVGEVLGGFNHQHDTPTGHVVGMVHIHPGQDTGVHARNYVKVPHPGYAYGAKGYPVGVFDKTFPAHTLFSDALRKQMIARGKNFSGSDGDVNFLLPKGYLSETRPNQGTINSIKRGERVGQNEQPIYKGQPVPWGYVPGREGPVDDGGNGGVRGDAEANGAGDVHGRLDQPGGGRLARVRPGTGSRQGQGLGKYHEDDPGAPAGRGQGNGTSPSRNPWGHGVSAEGVASRYLPKSKAVFLNANAFQTLATEPSGIPEYSQGALFSGAQKTLPISAADRGSHTAVSQDLQRGLDAQGGHSLLTVKHSPDSTLDQMIKFTRHEGIHATDARLGGGRTGRLIVGHGVPWNKTRFANNPAHAKLASALENLSPTYVGKSDIEALSYLGTDDYTHLGLTKPEANSLLQDFMRDLIEQHGHDKGISMSEQLFAHGRSVAREALRSVKAATSEAPPAPLAQASPEPSGEGSADTALGKWPIPTNADELSSMRKAGLLSAPKTLAKIVTAHIGFLGMEEASRLPASLLDGLVSHLTGRDRTLGNFSVPQLLQAAKVGATTGIREGIAVFRKGPGSVVSPVATTHPPLNSTSPLLNLYVNKIMGTHEAVYHALRTYALHRSLLEQAQVVTMSEVRNGATTKQGAKLRQQQLYNNPSSAMLIAAISSAEEATFQNRNQFSDMWSAAQEKGGAAGKLVMDQVLPFPKVPSNIGLQAAQYSAGAAYAPVRFAAAVMKNKGFTPHDQQQLSRTFGRGITGAGLIALGVALAHKGITTPSDEKHHQPGTIKIGGKLFPTNTVAPMMNMVQLGIDIANAKDHHDRGEATGVGAALGALLAEQPMLKLGDADPMGLLTGDAKGQKLIGQQLGSFVPTALSDIAASTDPVKRDQKGVLGPVMNRIPGLRQKLDPKTDLFGSPVPESGNRLFDFTGARAPTPMDTSAARQMQYYHDNPVPKDPGDKQLRDRMTLKARQGQLPVEDIRSAIRSGQLSPSAGSQLYRGNQQPRLLDPRVKEFSALPLDRASEVYRQSNAGKRQLFSPSLQLMVRKAQLQGKPVSPGVMSLLR